MTLTEQNQFGIYEKALPNFPWPKKFEIAKKYGFDFIEMSIDESESRLARLDWTDEKIKQLNELQLQYDIRIRSICFSGQRKYPLGSLNVKTQQQSLQLLKKCIILAVKLGVRIIQLAGYDVYYEVKNAITENNFMTNLQKAINYANRYGVMLALETMDDSFLNTITKYLAIKKIIPSPWLAVYPDIGNLSAWCGDSTIKELETGFSEIVALHIKDTLPVTETAKGTFKNVPFGKGSVDFIKIFKFLKKHNYTGSLMIEAWYEDYLNPENELKQALDFIKTQLKEVGW